MSRRGVSFSGLTCTPLSCGRPTRLSRLQGINVHLAKKMIEDRSRDYMNARRVAKVRRQPMPVK